MDTSDQNPLRELAATFRNGSVLLLDEWKDSVAAAFEREHLQPLNETLSEAAVAVDDLNTTVWTVRRVIENE